MRTRVPGETTGRRLLSTLWGPEKNKYRNGKKAPAHEGREQEIYFTNSSQGRSRYADDA